MRTLIDWISFSVMVGEGDDRSEKEMPALVSQALIDIAPDAFDWLPMHTPPVIGAGRKPYNVSWRFLDDGLSVYAHPRLPHALIEISGKGCEALREMNTLELVLAAFRQRVTRIDIACDMESISPPHEFAEMRDIGRFKAHSFVLSSDGETYYVGSKTSDRYARVYRYHAPHERWKYLRSEFVLKGELAKMAAPRLANGELLQMAAELGNTFGWTHPEWQPDHLTEAKAKGWRPDRREGKTLFWLADTVAPLLVRLHSEGVIDVHEWFAEHILPKVDIGDRL